jgi:hypothetical protein
MAATRLPTLATLVACAIGCAVHLHALPAAPLPGPVRERVQALRADLTGRWRCDAATRRALLSAGDDQELYDDVQASCPGAPDPD